MNKPVPCKLCDSDPVIERWWDEAYPNEDHYYVECSNEDCNRAVFTESEAIDKWNKIMGNNNEKY